MERGGVTVTGQRDTAGEYNRRCGPTTDGVARRGIQADRRGRECRAAKGGNGFQMVPIG